MRLEQARKFVQFITPVWPDPPVAPKPPHNHYLLVPLSTDRGLCGGVNTVIAREARNRLNTAEDRGDKKVSVITYGEKSRAALEMQYRKTFAYTIGESGKSTPLSFDQVLELSDLIFAQKADVIDVVWNRFKSLLVYETNVASFYTFATAFDHSHFLTHEREGDNELFENLYQYRFACRLWGFLKELETVELSSRMNAMTSSNKNANEMSSKLWLKYSRMRQDKITTELVEIISGAIGVEEGQSKD
jgi:F-type H+-transporting ATPase subunit gamma